MDDWQQAMADAIARGLNAAVDVTVYKETGAKTGILVPAQQQAAPAWFSTVQQPVIGMAPGQAGTPTGAAGGLPAWLPAVLIVGAVGLIAWKLAK